MELKALLEQRAAVGQEMNNLSAVAINEKRNLESAELERFDKMDSDFKDLSNRIETLKRVELARSLVTPEQGYTKSSHRPVELPTKQEKELAFKGWALSAAGKGAHITELHRRAMEKCNTKNDSDTMLVRLADDPRDLDAAFIERAQSSSVDSQGGYLQNDGVFQGLERNLKWFGGARQVAKVIRTDTGEPISWSYADDTANIGGQLGQNTTVTNTNVVYQKKTIGEYTYVSGVYPVSVQLLQDARIDVSSDVGEALGIRLGRCTNTQYTTGDGSAGPTGFMTDATLGATAATDTIAYNDLVKLKFSIDRAYRDLPSFAFTMSDSTLSALWQLQDDNGRPLFWNQMMNLASGMPLTILDKPIVINNDMPAPAVSGNKPIAAITGDKFVIRDVKDVQIIVLRERFMDQLAIGFMAYLRTDCKLLNPNTCKYLLLP